MLGFDPELPAGLQDADFEMRALQAAANDAAYAARKATHEPTEDDLRKVYDAAYQAAYYMGPAHEAATDRCLELGIDPTHGDVQDTVFDAMVAASKDDAKDPYSR